VFLLVADEACNVTWTSLVSHGY